MTLYDRVLTLLEQIEGDLRPTRLAHSKLVVGVSGGPDSLALLHALKELDRFKALVVAHLNHSLRPTADNEAQLVQNTAASWNLPCYIEKVDVAELARREGWSLEEAGRRARYRFLAQVATHVKAGMVAVAHNADDQAETVLMHILRGSGLAGLRGMLPISSVPGASKLVLIRPFFQVSRAQILAYIRRHGLTPIEDITNKDTTFFRNRLRHELLPLLAEYNPQVKVRLQHLATITAADYALLQELLQEAWDEILRESGDDWLRLDREGWLTLPLSLRRSTLRRAVEQLLPSGRDVAFRPIEQARFVVESGETGAKATLPGGLILTVAYDHFTIAADPQSVPTDLPQLLDETSVTLPVPGQVSLARSSTIEASLADDVDLAQIESNRDPWQVFVDVADADLLQVRPRRPGERFRPLGMQGRSASVKEVMINRKIPARLRPRWPLVANQRHLVWLVGHHLDERVRVTADSQRIIRLKCRLNSVTR
jgi:tRNA(Ile)-lysidine synthase